PTQSRRATRAVSSPWTQIVRGESEPNAAVASSLSTAVTEPAVAAAARPSLPSSSSANQTLEFVFSSTGGGVGRHYPKGNSHAKGTHLAVYLRLVDAKKLHSRSKIFTKFSLRFADHLHSKHCFGKGTEWPFLCVISYV
ncbi:hypothetical protein DVH24_025408, partial [Malus domestica]